MTAQGLRTKTNMVSRQKEIASTIADNKTLLASMLHNTLKSFLVQLIGLGQFKFAIRILFTSLSSDVIYRFLFFIASTVKVLFIGCIVWFFLIIDRWSWFLASFAHFAGILGFPQSSQQLFSAPNQLLWVLKEFNTIFTLKRYKCTLMFGTQKWPPHYQQFQSKYDQCLFPWFSFELFFLR